MTRPPSVTRRAPAVRTIWLGVLARVGRSLTAADSEEAVARALVDGLADELDPEVVTLSRPLPSGHSLRVVAAAGRCRDLLEGHTAPVESGCVGRAYQDGRTLLVEDVTREPSYVAAVPATRAELVVPLRVEGRLEGVLNVETASPGTLSTVAVDVIEAVVGQAGAVLELLHLRRRDELRLAEAAQVHVTALDLLETRPLGDTLRGVVAGVRHLTGADWASVFSVDADGGLRLLASDGSEEMREQVHDTLARTVVTSGETVTLDHGAHAAMAECAVPLRHGERVVGVVAATRRAADPGMAVELRRWMEMVAPSAALALDNANRTEAQLSDIIVAATVAHRLAAAADPSAIRRAVVEMGVDQIGAHASALVEPREGHLVCTARHGFARDLIPRREDGPGVRARVMRTLRPEFVADATRLDIAFSANLGATTALWVQPLVRHGVGVGCLVLGWPPRQAPDAREAALISLLADDAAAALERADLYARLDATARGDALTGTANRRHWDSELPRMLADAAARSDPLCVAMLDLDHFKAYNDLHGHQRGDELLRHVGQAWTARVDGRGLLARFGGEEFALALPGVTRDVALELLGSLRAEVPFEQTCSAGLAIWDGSEDPEALIARADAALYQAKRSGRDRVVVAHGGSDEAANGAPAAWTRWTGLVPDLVRGRMVRAVFQPVVDLAGRRAGAADAIVGFEALARPTGSFATMGVDGLFAAAQYRGMGGDLDWVCRRAALEAAGALPPGVAIFVNVGIGSLLDPVHDVDQLLLLLEHTRVAVGRVVLEITERDPLADSRRLAEVLARYRGEGLRIAVDDVGEGHSTLDLLAAAEPDFIKVTGALCRELDDPGARAAVRAVVAFAEVAGARVIAEGIESQAAADRMLELGVPLGQGYALGPPAEAVA